MNLPLTPSRYHEHARNRATTHDKLQAEFLDFLRTRPIAGLPEGAMVARVVEGEYPITRRGQVVSFVDAIELLTVNLDTTCNLFEIKPHIETVFGIVRQAKAMLALAESCIPATLYYCHVIVPHTDQLLADLRKEWPHTWAWGARFEDGEE